MSIIKRKVSFNVKGFPKSFDVQINSFKDINGLTKSDALTLLIIKGLDAIQNMSESEIEALKSAILEK